MRLFTAIELPPILKRHLSAGARATAQGWGAVWNAPKPSFTREENLHVTLKFLGEVAEQQVPALCESLSRVTTAGPIPLCIEGIEFFPQRGPIRVIAAKVGGDVGRLALLHRGIENACSSLGFEPERREYRPHVTVGRSRGGLPVALRTCQSTWQALNREPDEPNFEATEFVLMESRLHPTAPEYVPLARFPLGRFPLKSA